MTVGTTDPNYAAALDAVRQATAAVSGTDPSTGQPYSAGYTGLPAELTALQTRLQKDADDADNIVDWLVNTADPSLKTMFKQMKRLNAGEIQLTKGSKTLASAGRSASPMPPSPSTPASPASPAAPNGSPGASPSSRAAPSSWPADSPTASASPGRLQSGLRRAEVRVLAGGRALQRNVGARSAPSRPASSTPATSSSRRSTGRRRSQRERAGSTIDLQHGGQAANIMVIPTSTFNTPGSTRLYRRLQHLAGDFSRDTGLTTGVAGGPATLNDYDQVTRARIPWIVRGDHHRHLPDARVRAAGPAAGGARGGAQPRSPSASPSASSPCSSTCPRATRSAATPTSTRSA